MADRVHTYTGHIVWTGDRGTGTSGYRDFARDHDFQAGTKPPIAMSSDAAFRGDAARWNPEDMLLGSLSSCHMLWYLHLASQAGVIVRSYIDNPVGRMLEDARGGGCFEEVLLKPQVTISRGDLSIAVALHDEAHTKCYIANSVNFPVRCQPHVILIEAEKTAL